MSISRDNATSNKKAFTLIEMIGVLAVIAILAAVLIPKVFNAINNARVNNAAMSIQTIKTAVIDHYAKYNSLTAGLATPPVAITIPTNEFDGVLLSEGLLDKPFAVKIGDGLVSSNGTGISTTIMLDIANSAAQAPTAPTTATENSTVAGQGAFSLNGATGGATGTNTATGTAVVYAIISGVAYNDALQLKQLIDGSVAPLAETTPGSVSLNGAVKYNIPSGTGAVYVYITSR